MLDKLVTLGVNAFAAFIFVAIGLILFGAAFWITTKVAPFSVRKELEEDQNTALAIVIGAVIIGIALIVSASLLG